MMSCELMCLAEHMALAGSANCQAEPLTSPGALFAQVFANKGLGCFNLMKHPVHTYAAHLLIHLFI